MPCHTMPYMHASIHPSIHTYDIKHTCDIIRYHTKSYEIIRNHTIIYNIYMITYIYIDVCTLWWTNIAMERPTIFHGKILCFDWAIFHSKLLVHQRVCTLIAAIEQLKRNHTHFLPAGLCCSAAPWPLGPWSAERIRKHERWSSIWIWTNDVQSRMQNKVIWLWGIYSDENGIYSDL